MVQPEFYPKILHLIHQRGMSERAAYTAAGLSPNIGQVMKVSCPTIKTIVKLANFLEMPAEVLLKVAARDVQREMGLMP